MTELFTSRTHTTTVRGSAREVEIVSDVDPVKTREWLDSLDAVLQFDGADRAYLLLDELIGEARRTGVRCLTRRTRHT